MTKRTIELQGPRVLEIPTLVVVVVDPMGGRHVLTNLEGGSADDFDYGGTIDLGTVTLPDPLPEADDNSR